MQLRRLLLIALAASCIGAAPAPVKDRIANVETGLAPRLRIEGEPLVRWPLAERQKHHKVPAVSVAVINDGQIEWAKGYGPGINERTQFQAASISKPVASLTALRLVARGELNLDEDVNKRLKSWKVPDNRWGKPVTLRQLLSHTAGLTVHGFPGYAKGVPIPTLVQILNGEKPANTAPIVVDVEPGSINRYSGGGYEVMQLLIEDVTGKPFAAVAKSLVLDPIGMKDSGYAAPTAGKAAVAYNSKGEPIPGDWHTYPEQTAAGLWTTPSDLARFLLAVQSSKLLPEALTKEMLTPVKPGYGLGFSIDGSGDAERFGHGGANAGYRCNAMLYKNGRKGVVIMTNSDTGALIAGEITRAVASEYGWPSDQPTALKPAALTPEQLSALAGEYAEGDFRVRITVSGARLNAAAFGQTFEYVPESDVRFVPVTDGAPALVFQKDTEGKATGISAGGRKLKKQ